MRFEVGEHLVRGAAVVGLEFLRQLAGDADTRGGIDIIQDLQGGDDSVRGFEEDAGFAGFEGGGEGAAALAGFHGKEAAEAEGVAGKTGADERGDDGGGAGQDFEGRVGFEAGLDEAVAGVRDAGHAGIADDGDGFPGACGGDKFGRAAGFVVLVERNERLAGNAVVGEQRGGVARVLAGDAIGGFQDLEGAQGDVAEVPDGGGDDDDAAGGVHGYAEGRYTNRHHVARERSAIVWNVNGGLMAKPFSKASRIGVPRIEAPSKAV
jgi:hypothetical protein